MLTFAKHVIQLLLHDYRWNLHRVGIWSMTRLFLFLQRALLASMLEVEPQHIIVLTLTLAA